MRFDRAISQLRRAARVLAVVVATLPALAGAQRGTTGRFELRDNEDNGARDRDRVQLQLTLGDRDGWNDWSTSFGIDASKLQGLDRRRLSADGDSIRFQLVREAGTIAFAGRVMDGRAYGRYAFTADPKFVDALKQRGYGTPWDDQQFQLALYDINLQYVDALRRQGYERPAIETLVRMGQHGVTYAYVKSLDSLGYRVGSVSRLVSLRDHGVTARYVRELADAGYRNLDADEVRTLRDHGVDGDFAHDLAALGYKGLTADDLRNARDHGVSADFVESIQKAGFRDASIREMIRLRDHGVSASFARNARERYDVRTINELVRLKNRGDY